MYTHSTLVRPAAPARNERPASISLISMIGNGYEPYSYAVVWNDRKALYALMNRMLEGTVYDDARIDITVPCTAAQFPNNPNVINGWLRNLADDNQGAMLALGITAFRVE